MAKTITPLTDMADYKKWRLKTGSLSVMGKEVTREQFAANLTVMHTAFQMGFGEHFELIPESELDAANAAKPDAENADETKKKGKPA